MSALLTGNLPLIADAPDGIRKLRGLILELAVRGKLVPQDPDDEPASELLKRIASRKGAIEAKKGSRKLKPEPSVSGNERPFDLPDSWAWARLADLVQILNGRAYAKSELLDAGTPVLRVGNLFTSNHWYYSDLTLESDKYCDAGDLIYSWSASFGPFIWQGTKVIYHYHIWKLQLFDEENLSKEFLYKFLLEKTAEIKAAGHGVSMVHMTKEKMERISVPVPPLAEQNRIVAKVDELMALCDRLDAEQADAEAAHARLVDALLAALTRSTDAADFAANWQRLAAHFDTLFTTEAAIDALKQTVLQLAVRGKLVPQDFKDISATSVSGDADGPPLLALPKGWETTSFGALCEVGGGMTPTKSRDDFWGEGVPWVSPKDMKVDFISESQDQITARALSETTIRTIPSGSLLVVVRGMILAHSFPVAITRVDVTINQDMKALIPRLPEIAPYLMLVCKGFKNDFLDLVERSTHGTCKLETYKLLNFSFGLPPLAERHRIVAKVAELMALCDRLKADLATALQRRATLADTLIAASLEAA